MLIKHIMTKEFETVAYDRTLDEALELMLSKNVNHIFVIEDGEPVAMLTTRKALIACYRTDVPVSEIPISGFSRGLEHRVGPNESVLMCTGKLRQSAADCLPVVDGMSVQGVITTDDVIKNLSNISEDMLTEDERRDEWTN